MTDAIAQAYDEETFVYVDIETLPSQDPAYLDKLRAEVTAPAQYKNFKSIAAWLDENREITALKALAKTSFDGGRGHVCTIAWAKNDGPVSHAHILSLGDEKAALESFFSAIDPYHSETLVGHNLAAFDIPFLLKRAICLGIRIPQSIPRDPKPWDTRVFDTMTAWAGARNRISQDALCDILGIPGKDGFDGSMVAEAWANGEHETIAEYCKSDVEKVRLIHQRFLAARF